MIVCFPFSLKDQEQAARCANWILELEGIGGLSRHKCLMVQDVRANWETVHHPLAKVFGRDNVETLTVTTDAWDHWPESCNHMFSLTARHIGDQSDAQPWLWLEPDAIPLRRGWVDALEAEYKIAAEAGKAFLGDRVDVPGVPVHLSGVAVYPAKVIDHAGLALIALEVAWDCAARDQILPRCQETKLIEHSWKHPTFENWEQVTREVDLENAAVYHASKDGSLILRLQEQRAREAGGVSLEAVNLIAKRDAARVAELSGEGALESESRRSVLPEGSNGGPAVISPSQPTTDILIKSYTKDYEWLSYCLRGLEKFASGFRKIIVIHPINEVGLTFSLEQPIPIIAMPLQERGEGYLWQQVVKFNAHECTDATYVLHIDSDTVATAPFTPETFMRDGKPLWLMTPYAGIQTPWQPITEKFLGEPVEFEFMRRFPMLIPRALHVAASKFVQIRHNMSAADYIMSQPAHDFSEFNALGALAYSRARDDFRWLDTTKGELPELVAIQSWSHGGLSDQLREKFETILGLTNVVKCEQSISQIPTTNVINASESSLKGSLPSTEGLSLDECIPVDGVEGRSDLENTRKDNDPNAGLVRLCSQHKTLLETQSKEEKSLNQQSASDVPSQPQVVNSAGTTKITNLNSPLSGSAEGVTQKSICSSGETILNGGGLAHVTEGSVAPSPVQGIYQTKEGWWVIDGDTHISKWVEDEGRLDHDQWLLPKILPEINEGDVVVDAGAFIGDHSIAYAKAVGGSGTVYCFEPNPLAAECLRRNVDTLPVPVFEVALSNENVAYPFEILPNAGASTIVPRSETNVQAITLDSLKLKRLNFFKIDVEGHELQVLKGAEETIMRCQPKLLIEINKWPLTRQGVESRQIFDWLKSHGYRWSSVQPMHVADPPHYDILCRPVVKEQNAKKVVPWASPLESKEKISKLISELNDFVIGASPSQIRFVRQELVVQGVTRRPKDYNWVVIRKKRNAMKRRLAKGIKDE